MKILFDLNNKYPSVEFCYKNRGKLKFDKFEIYNP